MPELRSTFHHDRYLFHAGEDATLQFARFKDTRDGDIRAEIEIRWNSRPGAGLLKHQRLNLLAERSIKTLSNELAARIEDFDWYGILTACCYQAVTRYREGDPPVRLADVDPNSKPRWLIPNIVEHEGPTVVAADGGSLKSIMAMALLATVSTGRTGILGLKPNQTGPGLYLDWEAGQYGQRNRLGALCAGMGIDLPDNIYHRTEYSALHQSADEISRYIQDLGVVFVIVDSKGMAIGGDSDKADPTRQLFEAVAKLKVPALIIDHITNEGARKGTDRPFGSAYNRNIARNVWMAKKELEAENEATVTWKHVKANNGPTGKRLSWQFGFTMDSDDRYETIKIRQVSPVTVASMIPPDGNTRDLIRHELARSPSPLTVAELSRLLDISANTVRARLNDGRADNEFANVAVKGEGKWTLGADYLDTEALPDPW